MNHTHTHTHTHKLWKILKEVGIPDCLPCLLGNLYAGQEATVRTEHEQWTGSKLEKGYILSPCFFNIYAEYIMQNAGLDDSQVGIKIAGRNINNLSYAGETPLMGESKEELEF